MLQAVWFAAGEEQVSSCQLGLRERKKRKAPDKKTCIFLVSTIGVPCITTPFEPFFFFISSVPCTDTDGVKLFKAL